LKVATGAVDVIGIWLAIELIRERATSEKGMITFDSWTSYVGV